MTSSLLEEAFVIQRPATDAPSRFLQVGSFMALAGILAPRTFFQFGSQRLRPSLGTLIIADSSSFRKSEAIRWARRIIAGVDDKLQSAEERSQRISMSTGIAREFSYGEQGGSPRFSGNSQQNRGTIKGLKRAI